MVKAKLNDADYESWLKRRKKKDTLKEFSAWFNYYHKEMDFKEVIIGQFYQTHGYLYQLVTAANKLMVEQNCLTVKHELLDKKIEREVKALKLALDEQTDELAFVNESIDELYYKLDETA